MFITYTYIYIYTWYQAVYYYDIISTRRVICPRTLRVKSHESWGTIACRLNSIHGERGDAACLCLFYFIFLFLHSLPTVHTAPMPTVPRGPCAFTVIFLFLSFVFSPARASSEPADPPSLAVNTLTPCRRRPAAHGGVIITRSIVVRGVVTTLSCVTRIRRRRHRLCRRLLNN